MRDLNWQWTKDVEAYEAIMLNLVRDISLVSFARSRWMGITLRVQVSPSCLCF